MTIAFSRRSLLGAASVGSAALTFGGAAVIAAPVKAKPPLFGPAPGTAWLTYNENPYGPSPRALQAMADAASKGCYYADDANALLQRLIAERFGLAPGQVVIGNG